MAIYVLLYNHHSIWRIFEHLMLEGLEKYQHIWTEEIVS